MSPVFGVHVPLHRCHAKNLGALYEFWREVSIRGTEQAGFEVACPFDFPVGEFKLKRGAFALVWEVAGMVVRVVAELHPVIHHCTQQRCVTVDLIADHEEGPRDVVLQERLKIRSVYGLGVSSKLRATIRSFAEPLRAKTNRWVHPSGPEPTATGRFPPPHPAIASTRSVTSLSQVALGSCLMGLTRL